MENTSSNLVQAPFFIGVDVGGTSIKIGLVDNRGATLAYCSLPTASGQGPEVAIGSIQQAILRLLEEVDRVPTDISGIGLGTPGSMDIPLGLILEPPNLPGWRNFPIRDALATATGIPVTYANDANAAAFGEYWIGSGKKHPSIVMLTLGTGVGGGIIINGNTIVGENSHGGECGHVLIDSSPEARVCSCGLRGHLEAYASATAVIRRCTEALDDGMDSILQTRRQSNSKITGLDIAQAAEQNDSFAQQLVLETADYLATGISIFLNTIDPSAIVLGGAMNFGGESHPVGKTFIQRVRQSARQLTLPVVADNVTITYAELGGDAGYIGAAGLAREAFHRSQPTVTSRV